MNTTYQIYSDQSSTQWAIFSNGILIHSSEEYSVRTTLCTLLKRNLTL